jgi:hypothetical protein
MSTCMNHEAHPGRSESMAQPASPGDRDFRRTLVRRTDQSQTALPDPPSVKELEADVTAWIKAWNDDPKPFVWTRTADEILANLAHYLTRINQPTNDSEH